MTTNVKRILLLLASAGVIAVVVGGSTGTFASFNAQVANQGNYIATGTLFLHDAKQGQAIPCRSEDNTSGGTANQNLTCSVLFNQTNLAPGTQETANIDISNAGTLNASHITLATGCTASVPVIATTTGYAAAASTITVSALPYAILAGTKLNFTHTGNSTSFDPAVVVTQDAAVNDTTLHVDNTTDTVGSGGTLTHPADVHYTATFDNTLCNSSGLQYYVQEMDNTWTNPVTGCALPSNAADCLFGSSGRFDTLDLSDATGPTNLNPDGLNAGQHRYFTIGFKVPNTGVDNSIQNSQANLTFTWTIAQ
jgi:predicted ribosomally synthesized peptide with SipW-like signal peptide